MVNKASASDEIYRTAFMPPGCLCGHFSHTQALNGKQGKKTKNNNNNNGCEKSAEGAHWSGGCINGGGFQTLQPCGLFFPDRPHAFRYLWVVAFSNQVRE
jgi:hypothetical protein